MLRTDKIFFAALPESKNRVYSDQFKAGMLVIGELKGVQIALNSKVATTLVIDVLSKSPFEKSECPRLFLKDYRWFLCMSTLVDGDSRVYAFRDDKRTPTVYAQRSNLLQPDTERNNDN